MRQEQWNSERQDQSFTALFGELRSAIIEIISSEIALIKEESKETGARLARHAVKAAIFGALLALSTLPLIAFLVIGLGKLLNENYWLSSLIVGVIFAVVGGVFAAKTVKEIKENDLDLPETRHIIEREKEVFQRKLNELKDATHRRAV